MYDRLRNRLDAGRKDGGFTLIELLIVIIILGILAAIVVFAVGGISDRGDKAACKSDFKTVETAQEAYYAQNKAYAASTQALKDANLMRSVPAASVSSSNKYAITTATTGVVTVTVGSTSSTDTSRCDAL